MEIQQADRFEFLPHTADVAVLVRGESLPALFENAAAALFALMVDLECVQERTSRDVELRSADLEGLLVDWLNELLFLFETERMLFRRFQVRELDTSQLRATAWGEGLDLSRHRVRTSVKAATYHGLEIERVGGLYTARMVFDV